MMNIVLFKIFKVDIMKTCEENVCFSPRDSDLTNEPIGLYFPILL